MAGKHETIKTWSDTINIWFYWPNSSWTWTFPYIYKVFKHESSLSFFKFEILGHGVGDVDIGDTF